MAVSVVGKEADSRKLHFVGCSEVCRMDDYPYAETDEHVLCALLPGLQVEGDLRGLALITT